MLSSIHRYGKALIEKKILGPFTWPASIDRSATTMVIDPTGPATAYPHSGQDSCFFGSMGTRRVLAVVFD